MAKYNFSMFCMNQNVIEGKERKQGIFFSFFKSSFSFLGKYILCM